MSTLKVENLTGITSGANANKIIVPAGQTLDVSAGAITPSAGQIIQRVHTTWNTETSNTSNSAWVDVADSNISVTPKLATSRLFITAHYHFHSYGTSEYAGGMCRIVHDGTSLDSTTQFYELYTQQTSGGVQANIHTRNSKCMTIASGNTNARTIKLQIIKYGGAPTAAKINQGAYYYSTIVVDEVVQ